jgi:hypothetical protein
MAARKDIAVRLKHYIEESVVCTACHRECRGVDPTSAKGSIQATVGVVAHLDETVSGDRNFAIGLHSDLRSCPEPVCVQTMPPLPKVLSRVPLGLYRAASQSPLAPPPTSTILPSLAVPAVG